MTSRPIFSQSRKRFVRVAVALCTLIVAVLLAAGCTGLAGTDNQKSNPDQDIVVASPSQPTLTQLSNPTTSSAGLDKQSQKIPNEKYVFFEHHIDKSGVTIDGQCSPGMNIDFPTYSFDTNSGKLTISSLSGLKKVNESLILIYGSRKSLDGLAGSGGFSMVSPAYSFPSSFSHGENVTFDSIMADGTVFFQYDNLQLSLKPDESWENVTRVIEKFAPDYRFNCTAEFVTTDRFYNAGILDKKNIITG
jgi:hypothetical protein